MPQDLESGPDATHSLSAPPTDRSQAHPPGQPQPVQPTQPEKVFSDPSGPLFSMYLERAEEEDKKMVDNWKGDAEGILVFTGLFSATVATFLGITFQGLQLNSQDASAFYLSRIYQQSASDSGSQVSIPSTISDPATFTPSTTTVWVNALWFLSLVISLTCALLATMLQQWARHYLRVTQTRYQPHKRARIRTFYFKGVERFRVAWAIDALPALLHLSVFLFYAGLSVLLFTVNLTIFKVVVSWVALCLSVYVAITMMPAVFPNSPYRTPLSTLCWSAPFYTLRLPVNVLESISRRLSIISYPTWEAIRDLESRLQKLVTSGMLKTAEQAAMKQPPDVDSWALSWTWDSLDEDHELEQFLAGVPGFVSSKATKEPEQVLKCMDELGDRSGLIIYRALDLMSRPVGLSVFSEAAQCRRWKICSEAAFTVLAYSYLTPSTRYFPYEFLYSAPTLEQMAKASDQDIVSSVKCMAHLARLAPSRWLGDVEPQNHQVISRITGLPPPPRGFVHDPESTLDFIRQVAFPYLDEPPRTMSTKAITSTLRYLGSFNLSFIDCDIWNQAAIATPDQDENEVALHILASLSTAYRIRHSQASEPSPGRFRSVETFQELIVLNRSDFPLCTEAHHHHPVPPTSSCDAHYAEQPQCAPPPPAARNIVLEPSVSTPPIAPAAAMVATTETGEASASDAETTPLPSTGSLSSTQEVRHSAALAATTPNPTVIVSLSVSRGDAGSSAHGADSAPPAADTVPNGPDDMPNSDGFQLHGVVAAATASIVSVDPRS
ncbi:hypothetical protein BC834DRAFT_845784 [Gloeopeniophorella convolvens]|nr:hypothetical protein BC834DRAFT_845784 [Gloeopeniophorella convolvens]